MNISPDQPKPRLTPRQRQCIYGVLDLRPAKQIARDLGISHHVVEKHLRIVREKFGVGTTAEAAKLFVMTEGREKPPPGSSDLVGKGAVEDYRIVLRPLVTEQIERMEDNSSGALLLDHSLSPGQTLLSIAAVSLISIIGLLLLIACAQGIQRLVLN